VSATRAVAMSFRGRHRNGTRCETPRVNAARSGCRDQGQDHQRGEPRRFGDPPESRLAASGVLHRP
jgi:hypothetical protein